MKNDEGIWVSSHRDLELEGKDYFFCSFKDLGSSNILSQSQVIKHFIAFFNEVEGHSIGASVSRTELGGVLKHLERDKILGTIKTNLVYYGGFKTNLG